MFACNKPTVNPTPQSKTVQENSITTNPNTNTNNVVSELLFKSNLDDSLYFESDTILYHLSSPYEWGYLIQDNGFEVLIKTTDPDSVELGLYTNEYLTINTSFGINLTHNVYLADGSKASIQIGSTSTQINTLEVTKIQNDSVWFNYDVDWHFKHWLHTNMNKSGTMVGEVNGFKYR